MCGKMCSNMNYGTFAKQLLSSPSEKNRCGCKAVWHGQLGPQTSDTISATQQCQVNVDKSAMVCVVSRNNTALLYTIAQMHCLQLGWYLTH